MIVLRNKCFSKKEKEKKSPEEKALRAGEVIAGLGTGAVGLKVLDDVHKSGEVSGRVKLYHGTSKKAKESILKEGLKGSHALDPDNLTNTYLGDLGKKDGRHLVYTGKRRTPAILMALNTKMRKGEDPAMVKMSIPYDEYKKMKRVYDNPEFKGAASYEDWLKKTGETDSRTMRSYYDSFSGAKGTKGTRIFEGDISSKRIKGSKDYVRNSVKEITGYIKNHPKRFLKGLGKTTAGVGLAAGGGLLLSGKLTKNNKKDDSTKK